MGIGVAMKFDYNKIFDNIMEIFAWTLVVFIILFLCISCRNTKITRIEYDTQGRIAATVYTDDSGFRFFSEGDNKTITLSPTITADPNSFKK